MTIAERDEAVRAMYAFIDNMHAGHLSKNDERIFAALSTHLIEMLREHPLEWAVAMLREEAQS